MPPRPPARPPSHHRPRPWRRRLLFAALAVLLGAVTTVGVAWACAAWAPEPPPRRYPGLKGGLTFRPWRSDPPAGWPDEADDWDIEYTRLITHWTLTAGGQSFSTAEFQHQEVVESGWPMRALFTVWHTEGSILASSPGSVAPSSAVKQGLQVEWLTGTSNALGPGVPRSLPLMPLLPGFLLDTLFYAVPWWALLATPGLVKRWRRKRRGACVACGYDLRGLPGGTVLRTVTDEDGGDDIKGEKEDTARRAVPPKCPECGT